MKTPLSLRLNFVKNHRPRKLPIVLTQDEIECLIKHIAQTYFLPAALLYGNGLRLMEAVRLRIKDIDFDFKCIRIWNGKGGKHRTVTMASELQPYLRSQINKAEHYLTLDERTDNYAGVWLPINHTELTDIKRLKNRHLP